MEFAEIGQVMVNESTYVIISVRIVESQRWWVLKNFDAHTEILILKGYLYGKIAVFSGGNV